MNTSFVVDISEKLSPSDYIVILGGGAFASIYTHPGQEDQVSSVCFRFPCWSALCALGSHADNHCQSVSCLLDLAVSYSLDLAVSCFLDLAVLYF